MCQHLDDGWYKNHSSLKNAKSNMQFSSPKSLFLFSLVVSAMLTITSAIVTIKGSNVRQTFAKGASTYGNAVTQVQLILNESH